MQQIKVFNKIIIFTDGACTGNGKVTAKAGIGIHFPNNEFDDISEKFTVKPITNQRAELCAIKTALEKVIDECTFKELVIYSDSSYSIKSVTEWIKNWEKNNWKNASGKPVKNLDLIKPIRRMLSVLGNKVTFVHVRAHTGAQTFEAFGNDKADKLATGGI